MLYIRGICKSAWQWQSYQSLILPSTFENGFFIVSTENIKNCMHQKKVKVIFGSYSLVFILLDVSYTYVWLRHLSTHTPLLDVTYVQLPLFSTILIWYLRLLHFCTALHFIRDMAFVILLYNYNISMYSLYWTFLCSITSF
jgi:hypothetical protein